MRDFVFVLTIFLVSTSVVHAAGRQELRGQKPEAVSRLNLQPVDRLPGSQRLHLAIGLPLRNKESLNLLLQQMYDPSSPEYRRYLTPEQFTERFGPTVQDYQAVMDFAKANGLTVTATFPNRLVLDVEGTVSDIEKALQVTMRVYSHPKELRRFFAPDKEPSLDLIVPVLHISGLDNYSLPRPAGLNIRAAGPSAGATPNAGSGPGGSYRGNDFRAAYVPGTPLTGAGQIIGLLQFDGYNPSDITNYANQAGLSYVTITNVPVDGGVAVPGGNNAEVCLDIEMAISMAPGMSKLIVYEAPNPSPWEDLLNEMATDNQARQISCSWFGGSPNPTAENVFQVLAAQGVSFFSASGDTNAFVGAIPFPSDSTNITIVGGTTLTTTGPGGSYVSETVWNWGIEIGPSKDGVGSSGGISTFYSIPPWQLGVSMTNNQGSTTMRNIPDVALTADNIYVTFNNGASNFFGGTSCAAPLWAGFTALMNQQAVANGKPTVGFLNPAIYTIGKGTNYTSCFHDITTGNNEWSGSPTNFSAVAGYDLCTGWGTPNGTNLINALVGPPTNTPHLALVGSIVSGGNGNGVIDANECNQLYLAVQNIGFGTATAINATLMTTTPGVTVTQPFATYPNLTPDSIATNTAPFQISTSPAFVCGTPISLSLALSYAGGSNTSTLTLPTCLCSGIQTNRGLSVSSQTQTGRLTRNNIISACGSPKSCPGAFTLSGAYAYDAYSFTNLSSGAVCVTVTLSTSCSGNNLIFSAAYLGSFNPTSLCANYLADIGTSPAGSGSFSFNIPANTNVIVVVHAVNPGFYCSSYALTVAGLPCNIDGGGACPTLFQEWQLQYFGCTNCPQAAANADPLGKGIVNTNQFLLGLNPTNSASMFRIVSVELSNGNSDAAITWTTAGVRTNAVQATDGAPGGDYSNNFADISGPIIINGNGDAITNYLDGGAATNGPSRYYRIRLVP